MNIGEMTVKITINKDEILRDIDEILERLERIANPITTVSAVNINDEASTTTTNAAVPTTPTRSDG